ncbi:iron-containing alcohol dehydrogenase [Photobacterium sp. WH77]|uniref:Iron-containing alcohol dehydrogenase n=1 Tax=Photobacterium arenosum TaxID=2774143 RepID=A0ABR9BQI4_9GAMM|nr:MULTISPECIES: iron-containing alcohol dehydrogenase [Photobacterium]MBD8513741.1 iron-containing alcohol dehydrogenase [Photobacterium arenosum]MBV7262818.1 iron-containing alcohol dehydrogenase [Photobacterium sp. WH24]MCG2837656.1 iron-containing alcohol dehydrogenase [Photobacterium sp. WH77]MCG2845272.1 iron-containing alcohol dehydrogenase [Photobacterium sp. WH80]
MNPFSYHNPTRIHFGEGQIAAITNEIPKSSKVLVLYGGGSIKANGVYDQVAKALSEHQWTEFAGIEPNPQYDTLMKAVDTVKTEGIDYLLAVGGGSVADGTKFVAAAACYEGADPWDMWAKGLKVDNALPIGCILTLPATGSESNKASVVSRGNDKIGFMSSKIQPAFAVLDPATTLSLSPRQISNGVVDAYIHVMEQYLTFPVNAKVQDRFAEGLLLTLIEEGPKALTNPKDLAVRANIMWSATQALNGLIGVGVPQDWATHMIGHELTGNYGIDHARTLSIVLPAVMKERRQEKEAKLLQYAERIFGIAEGNDDERIYAAIAKTEAFFKAMQVPTRLKDVELDESDIRVLLSGLEKHGMTALGEHGKIGLADSEAILRTAL